MTAASPADSIALHALRIGGAAAPRGIDALGRCIPPQRADHARRGPRPRAPASISAPRARRFAWPRVADAAARGRGCSAASSRMRGCAALTRVATPENEQALVDFALAGTAAPTSSGSCVPGAAWLRPGRCRCRIAPTQCRMPSMVCSKWTMARCTFPRKRRAVCSCNAAVVQMHHDATGAVITGGPQDAHHSPRHPPSTPRA